MRRMKIFAAAIPFALLLAGAAHAADLPMPPLPPLVQKAPVLVEEYASGWYLRGDFGYRFNAIGDVLATVAPNPSNTRVDDSIAVGGGLGYKAGWFRADATFDYGARASYRGDTPAASANYTTKIDTYTVLGNAYLDLGTWSGFTPYVGGGAGGSFLRTGDFATAVPAMSGTPILGRWQFTWAAMGGFSYAFAPKVLLDLGYRYINFGDALTQFDAVPNQLNLKNLAAQEVRIGVRYTLD